VLQRLEELPPAPLLTAGIARSFRLGARELADAAGQSGGSSHEPAGEGYQVAPQVMLITADQLVTGSRLLEECFGPVALVCEYEDTSQVLEVLDRLQPSLAAAVFSGEVVDTDADELVAHLVTRVGRVALNAWPTGVATSWSQQHGGPWPAASRLDATSVGAGALARFVRPVALQNARPSQLPPALQPDNPWLIPRRIDGALTLPHRKPQSS
jgi:NADP-dependent aldehyde dehydrogenase